MTVVGSYEFNLEDEYSKVGLALIPPEFLSQFTSMITSMFTLYMLMMLMAMVKRVREKR